MIEGGSVVEGRLVLDDRVAHGRVAIEDAVIVSVEVDDRPNDAAQYIVPGFVDVHVHGWGGHDAMGGREALDGMARALLRRGVTSFLPTGYTQPWQKIVDFANTARAWSVDAPDDGADPLGFNLEGPFVAPARKGAHEPSLLRTPAEIGLDAVDAVLEGCLVMTVAPELPGALELIARLRERGVAASMGHSAATLEEAQAGYAAGGTTTTHLFNAMSGVDHHSPGLAVAALTDDDVYVELIADGHHVNESIWPIITRTKPVDRLMLISDAIPLAGMGDGRARIGGLEVEVVGGRVTLVGTTTLAGSVIALDSAVRNLARSGVPLPAAVAAASRNPLAMLGISDRGEIAVGQRADLVELDEDLRVRRVMRAGAWFPGPIGRWSLASGATRPFG
jgi:N-acetylglucosamine-6-phosphate deacetylase